MNLKKDDKIKLIEEMKYEFKDGRYIGVKVGSIGKIKKIEKLNRIKNSFVINVEWDSGEELSLIYPFDKIKKI